MHLIKNLPEFNEFENFMIDYYSYKISRNEASKRLFKGIWSELKPFATKYKFQQLIWMKIKVLIIS